MRFRERPDSWYDPPDEPSDAEEERCREEWEQYVEDSCETCSWTTKPDKDEPQNDARCADCRDSAPQDYYQWCADWHTEQARRWADD